MSRPPFVGEREPEVRAQIEQKGQQQEDGKGHLHVLEGHEIGEEGFGNLDPGADFGNPVGIIGGSEVLRFGLCGDFDLGSGFLREKPGNLVKL